MAAPERARRGGLRPPRRTARTAGRQHLPFAADFLLDTTRAAYLLVRNGIARRYPGIRFILSHAGGFVPYASHRMAVAIAGDTGRSILDVLDDFRTFYFDTALSSSPAALPTLLPGPRLEDTITREHPHGCQRVASAPDTPGS